MAEALSTDDLRPYQSALVARAEDGQTVSASQVAKKLRKALRVRTSDTGRRVVASGTSTDPDTAFFRYVDSRQVAWSSAPVLDRVNHLAAVVVKGPWVAIHTTEGSRRDTVKRALRARELGPLQMVPAGQLKAAFMRGAARTLWMRGTHRSTSYMADTKVLGGPDLAPALDPLGDQSYRYTAARCEPKDDNIGDVMGLAVEQSRFWVGPSRDWAEFERPIVATLEALERTVGDDEEPLPVLATGKADLAGVEGAYDIAIAPPEILMQGPVLDGAQAAQMAEMEEIAFATQFEVTDSTDSSVTADVLRRGQTLGEVELDLRVLDGEIRTAIDGIAAHGHRDVFDEILGKLADPELLTVYFESGHTLQSGKVFTVRHRDSPFAGWKWVPFGDEWSVEQEKPDGGIGAIGTEKSLFDWVLANWPLSDEPHEGDRWLACDDRPGETADFLHIDESGDVPLLTLIHVKAAKSASTSREVAVVPYETVSAQAIKNLRHLDAALAAGALISGTIPSGLDFAAWKNGEGVQRSEFTDRLDGLGTNFARRVAIVQPHVRKELVDDIRANPEHGQVARLRRLDTLLHGVAANCQSAGAEFLAIGAI